MAEKRDKAAIGQPSAAENVKPEGRAPWDANASWDEKESWDMEQDAELPAAYAAPEDPSLLQLAEHVSAPAPAPEEQAAESGGFSLADDPELVGDFIQEAAEHLGVVETLTLVIEQTPDDRESLNALFRSFHSIKGLAGFLELDAIRDHAHEVETLLDLARNGQTQIETEAIDCILASADFIRRGVDALSMRLQGKSVPLPAVDRELLQAVASMASREIPAQPQAEAARMEEPAGEVRLSGSAADSGEKTGIGGEESEVGAEGETQSAGTRVSEAAAVEVTAIETAAGKPGEAKDAVPVTRVAPPAKVARVAPPAQVASSGEPAAAGAGGARSGGSVKVETAKLDYLVDMVGEFVIAQSIVRHDPDLRLSEYPRLQRNFLQMARITAEIQRTAMSMRMVPIQGLFQRMARLVRDLARKTGKDVEFVPVGEDTELDRTLIEQLADPLMHMVRNSLDHGIETTAERMRTGKNPRGRVQLRAAHESGGIVIEISDDGRGLNREKILARAIERGILPPNANPPDSEVWGLIFEPGFSTAEKVTEISGRGVGMDVVRRNIQQLRGRIEVSSVAGKGASMVLRLPLTLAIIDALMVGTGEDRFILPMYAVREMFRPEHGAVTKVRASQETGGADEVVDVRGSLLPIHRLDGMLGVLSKAKRAEDGLLVVLENQSGTFCLLVDEFLGKQEVVIKPLGAMFQHVAGISAGAILGDGKVALILDVDGLVQRRPLVRAGHGTSLAPAAPATAETETAKGKRVDALHV